ncbi:phosphoribosylformylglycinamidine synthase I [bacterium DOLZORAL124_38_8]|nr:MAG: phosphoribosylformylglycinamidine synthase I [bacterium DOLZORAL124_38_8]
MAKPKVLVMGGCGINCETETMFAFDRAGAESQYVHVNDLVNGDVNLDEFQIWAFPGGFSFGDHTGSGKALANKLKNNLAEKIQAFVQRDTLAIGICNGFQVMTQLGLVPALGGKYGEPQAGLMRNESTQYQCEWVDIKTVSKKCVWSQGIEKMPIPIAHGEGNFYINDEGLAELKANDQIVFSYDGYNPNGSVADIAGICDPSGRILGMMPHPERFLFAANHPQWTKHAETARRNGEEFNPMGLGQKIFDNGVAYFL